MILKTNFGTYYNIKFEILRYFYDNSLCVKVWDTQEGCIAGLSKCLDDKKLKPNQSYIDTDNNPWVIDFLKDNQLARPVNKTKQSGYCTYPLYEFDLDKLKKYEL